MLALGGGNVSATDQSVETLVAVNILNAVSGALNKTILFYDQTAPESSTHQDLTQLISDLNAGKIKLLIVDDSNPVYALPPSMGFLQAMKKAFVVSLASQKSETTHAANLVLPALTAYESWGDAFPRNGVRSIQQPVMSTVNMFDARAREDILLSVAQSVNKKAFSGNSSYLDYLQNIWQKIELQPFGSVPPAAPTLHVYDQSTPTSSWVQLPNGNNVVVAGNAGGGAEDAQTYKFRVPAAVEGDWIEVQNLANCKFKVDSASQGGNIYIGALGTSSGGWTSSGTSNGNMAIHFNSSWLGHYKIIYVRRPYVSGQFRWVASGGYLGSG